MAYSRPTISQYWPRSESTGSIVPEGLQPGQGGASSADNPGMEANANSSPGLTFTYTAADIQGLADPTHIGRTMMPPHAPGRDHSISRAGAYSRCILRASSEARGAGGRALQDVYKYWVLVSVHLFPYLLHVRVHRVGCAASSPGVPQLAC